MKCGVDRLSLNVVCSTVAALFGLLTIFAPLSASVSDGKTLGERDVLRSRAGMLHVAIGRSVDVIPGSDIDIVVRPGDHCTVRVLDSVDSLSQLAGRLAPSEFPCRFTAGSVTYQHHGSRRPSDDTIRLQIR